MRHFCLYRISFLKSTRLDCPKIHRHVADIAVVIIGTVDTTVQDLLSTTLNICQTFWAKCAPQTTDQLPTSLQRLQRQLQLCQMPPQLPPPSLQLLIQPNHQSQNHQCRQSSLRWPNNCWQTFGKQRQLRPPLDDLHFGVLKLFY